MSTIHIRKKIESETLHLPELKSLIGKTVEITVHEVGTPNFTPGTGDWEAARKAVEELRETGYDFDAWREMREYDKKHANDHLL